MKVLQVPQSDNYPLGLKYSFQDMAADGTRYYASTTIPITRT
ncbi:hypothetical protein [Halococcus sediminicola]|nr:hypothetical protein [Halococcus sediminicola]